MDKLSEEEIIDKVMMIDQWKVSGDIYTQNELNAIGELLDLYNKEKEKNKELIKERATEIVYVDRNFIRKDRIKPIQIIDLDGKIHNVYKIEEE